MLKVAVTGGIGSGKSTVANRFAKLGASIIDTDQLAYELTAPGQPALATIADAFGRGVIDADGALDRAALRCIVFKDPQQRQRLEAILHPLIRRLMLERLEAADGPYAMPVIPLLFETGQTDVADRILVVDVTAEIQVTRVTARSALSRDEVERIMASQVSREVRLAGADDIIDNSRTVEQLGPRIQELHQKYLRLNAPHSIDNQPSPPC